MRPSSSATATDPAPAPTPPANRVTPTPGAAAPPQVEHAVDEFLTVQDAALADPGPTLTTDALAGVVTGVAAGELAARAAEFSNEGLQQVGEVKAVSVTVVAHDEDAEPPTMTVEVCLDLSGVDVLDNEGTSLGDRLYRPGHPIRDLYTLHQVQGAWAVAFHEVPADDDCSTPLDTPDEN